MPASFPLTPACPHCGVEVASGWSPEHAGRCATCRLVIGAGRTIEHGTASITAGTAAGLLANAARRADAHPADDPATVTAALQWVADHYAVDVARLRMLDYRRAAATDRQLPDIDVVLATFSTWKRARSIAASESLMANLWRLGDPDLADDRLTR